MIVGYIGSSRHSIGIGGLRKIGFSCANCQNLSLKDNVVIVAIVACLSNKLIAIVNNVCDRIRNQVRAGEYCKIGKLF